MADEPSQFKTIDELSFYVESPLPFSFCQRKILLIDFYPSGNKLTVHEINYIANKLMNKLNANIK